jgi:acetolactate synthase-1/3 small subunit
VSEDDTPGAPGSLPGPGPSHRSSPDGERTELGIRVPRGTTQDHPPRRAVVSALVEHEPGVLSEVSGLFSRRQFNIESLSVGPTEDDDFARITIVVEEPDPGIEQVKRQLRTLVPVRSVSELEASAIERELALIEIAADRPEAVRTAVRAVGGEVLDATASTVTVEVTGASSRVDDAIATFEEFGVREVARTGASALARGETPTTERPPTTGGDRDATDSGGGIRRSRTDEKERTARRERTAEKPDRTGDETETRDDALHPDP